MCGDICCRIKNRFLAMFQLSDILESVYVLQFRNKDITNTGIRNEMNGVIDHNSAL